MIQRLFLLLLTITTLTTCQMGEENPNTYVLIETDYGNMKVMLYNSTPLHRDNFIKLAEEGYYNDLLFHRVIKGFMIQGGDPDSRGAAPGQRLGGGGPGYTIPAEINALHIKGALSAARTQNPEKASSGSQFYIVQGKPVQAFELDRYTQRHGNPYSEAQKKLYMELGGTPMLDYAYTVFGEVVEGLEVIDLIAAKETQAERPIEDVKMKVSVIK